MGNCLKTDLDCELTDSKFVKRLMTVLMIKIFLVGFLLLIIMYFLYNNQQILRSSHELALDTKEIHEDIVELKNGFINALVECQEVQKECEVK